MNQKNKYLILHTLSRGSKWYMGYGSVLLRLGGVWIQSPNQRLPYKLVDRSMLSRFGSSRGLNSAAQRQYHDSLWGAWYSGLQQTVTVIPPYFAGGPPGGITLPGPLHHSADMLSTSINSSGHLDQGSKYS